MSNKFSFCTTRNICVPLVFYIMGNLNSSNGQLITPIPPSLPTAAVTGGRVQSISVNPLQSDHIVVANQFGGLWITYDGGNFWHLLSLRELWVKDVAYCADGTTLIATVAEDLRQDNGGGIWMSRDEGATWEKPRPPGHIENGGDVPATLSGMTRTGAYGISYAPDDQNKIYVGTDYGVAVSTDNGATWDHQLVDAAGSPVWSIQALPGNRAIAVGARGVYVKSGISSAWNLIRRASFLWAGGFAFKQIDVSPYDYDKVFIIQDYTNLLLYEISANRWTTVIFPPGSLTDRRFPFIRVSRNSTGEGIDIWAGLGVSLYKASCTNFECAKNLQPSNWQSVYRAEGLHDDTGFMGLDGQKRPVLYGCDGGLFKPLNPEGTRWGPGATARGYMNSLQISSLAGTNIRFNETHLYFSTQDNDIWGSLNAGNTWNNLDCTEGWYMQAWHTATSQSDLAARVAYGSTGCWYSPRTCDANLMNRRNVPTLEASGRRLRGTFYSPFILSPGNWIRHYNPRLPQSPKYISLSTDNLEHWSNIGNTRLNATNEEFISGGETSTPTSYTAFQGSLLYNNTPRNGLIRMDDVLHISLGTITEESMIYLPDNGSLGQQATEFAWPAIYGVDPRNPYFIIAPDINNQTIWYSTRGGETWTPANELTDLVKQSDEGPLLIADQSLTGQMQVTKIAFSPYERNLILVGTREGGIIYSENHGNTWQRIPHSESMLLVTGFFFTPEGIVFASTYGRGLWKIDMRRRAINPIDPGIICGYNYGECVIRSFPDPSQNVITTLPWKDYSILIVFDGHINGAIESGETIKTLSLTSNSTYRYYAAEGEPLPEILNDDKGLGFRDDKIADYTLMNKELITGVVLKGGKFIAYITNKNEVKQDQPEINLKEGKEMPGSKPDPSLPYLSISTTSAIGPGIVQSGDEISFEGLNFSDENSCFLFLDGKEISEIKSNPTGEFSSILKIEEDISLGQHRLELIQKTSKGEKKAVALFGKVKDGDQEKN